MQFTNLVRNTGVSENTDINTIHKYKYRFISIQVQPFFSGGGVFLLNAFGCLCKPFNIAIFICICTLHNVLFVQYVFLPTEQSETYFKIFILTYDLTYICPGLFDWKENTFFFIFVYFKL